MITYINTASHAQATLEEAVLSAIDTVKSKHRINVADVVGVLETIKFVILTEEYNEGID